MAFFGVYVVGMLGAPTRILYAAVLIAVLADLIRTGRSPQRRT